MTIDSFRQYSVFADPHGEYIVYGDDAGPLCPKSDAARVHGVATFLFEDDAKEYCAFRNRRSMQLRKMYVEYTPYWADQK
jgi:hypothetical protein